ncbi:MAG: hypothetical protein Q8K63_08015, partial [Acidimicrobiales bacterium]|nr:hypothetical protein [Acidimicrobiales bacterium]
MTTRFRLPAVLLAAALAIAVSAPEAVAKTASQRKAEQVEKARELKTLQANDIQIRQAIKTLDEQVRNTDASTASARQSVKAARAAE